MKMRTNLKAGAYKNHNETLVRDAAAVKGLKVRTNLKAGGVYQNHNETLVRDAAPAEDKR
ncbi:MAG: hypothetical protein JWO48_1146 [Bryobacterales bacterium]|nr:hypothetical protein [Bryobacterales bacterium]